MLGTSATDNVNTILRATTINYIQKKDVLQTALTNFSPVYISNKQKLEDLKQETTKYGFFSKELFDLLTNEEYVTSIKDSLLSLEMIKFSSAQTELPSFAITFQKFDPTQKQISFKVDVNTFQQDEAALTKK